MGERPSVLSIGGLLRFETGADAGARLAQDQPWQDRVWDDAEFGNVLGQLMGEAENARLCRGIDQPGAAGDVRERVYSVIFRQGRIREAFDIRLVQDIRRMIHYSAGHCLD